MQNEQAEKLRNATQVFHLLQGKWLSTFFGQCVIIPFV